MAIPQLVLGAFNLTDWTGSAYQTSVIVEGTSKGAPVPLEVAVKSWLQDGSIVLTQGYDNRTVTLRVKMRGSSLTAVSQAEAALFAELGEPNTLTWTPASGPATVFDVVTSSMEESPGDSWDLAEAQASPWRTFNVRLLCLASTRSAAEVVAAALAASGSTTTLVDDGSATTNWTGTINGSAGTVAVVSGAVGVTSSALSGSVTISNTRTAAITTSSTKYLVVDWKGASLAQNPTLRAYGDGTELTKVGEVASPTAGFTRSWFQVGAAVSSIAALRLDSVSTSPGVSGASADAVVRSLHVDNINRTDVKPTLGTARQLLRTIDVAGSAPAQGSVAIEHASSMLGDTIAYFYPDRHPETGEQIGGYIPALRPYRVAGGATVSTDAAVVSGSKDDLKTGTTTWDIPLNRLPRGEYVFLARVLSATGASFAAATYSWTMQTRVNAANVGPSASGSTTFTNSATYAILPLTRQNLPLSDVNPGTTNGVLRVTMTASGTDTNIFVDEAWLFNTTIGQLVQVACPAANRLFLEPATIAVPRPTVRIGTLSDRSDSYYPGSAVSAWDFPKFRPSRVNVLSVTTGALDASVTLRYYPRWHTNAAS